MDNAALKDALLGGNLVTYNNIVYTVSAIIYRNNNGSVKVAAELLDKNNNCVVIADPKKVEVK